MHWSCRALSRALGQLALVAGIATRPAVAQVISGTVTDMGGAPVVGATIAFIEEETDGRSHVATTDDTGVYRIDFARATAVDYSSALPIATRLLPNYPNPFNPETVIPYRLAHAGPVQLTIYNVLGQPMRRLMSRVQEAGDHIARWDGRTDGGQGVAAGVYFAVFENARCRRCGKNGAAGWRPRSGSQTGRILPRPKTDRH